MRQLIRQLQYATHGDRPRQRQHRRVEMRRSEQGKTDHADIKKRRRKRRNGEAVPGVQDRPHQRGQRDQQNIGEGNAQQLRGQGKFIGRVGKTGRGHHYYPGRGQHPEHGHHSEGQRQQSGDIRHKYARRVFTLFAFIFRQDGNERLGKCPFSKNTTQQVRQFKRDEKGVRCHPCTKDPCHNRITRKTEYA